MVALLVGLRLRLLRHSLLRSVWTILGLVFGGLYALGLIALAYAGMVALRINDDPALTAGVTVLGLSLVTAGWVVFSVLVNGIDDALSPTKFALLPVPASRLQPGLLVAGLLGIPGIATTVVALSLVVAWSTSVPSVLAALVAVPLGVGTCFLLSRLATSALAELLATRRFRDLAVVVLALSGAGLGLGVNLLAQSAGGSPGRWGELMLQAGTVAGWTPLGWAWALPAAAGQQQWLGLGARLLLALVLVVGLWLGWRHFLTLRLTSPVEGRTGSGRVRTGGLADRVFSASPAGAVAARSLRYWRRDPRHVSNLAALVVLPVVIVALQLFQGQPASWVAFAPLLVSLLLGSVISMEMAYDGSALALHVHSGVSGRADRAGRLQAAGLLVLPLLGAVTVATVALAQRWDLLVPSLAMSVGTALVVAGVASWISVFWPGHAPPPGANPFGKGSSGGFETLLSWLVVTTIATVLSAPFLAAGIGSLFVPWLQWVALLLAVVVGGLVVVGGVVLGGRALDRRWPEVFTSITAMER